MNSEVAYNHSVDIICGKYFNPEGEHCEYGYHKETCQCLIVGGILNHTAVDKTLHLGC